MEQFTVTFENGSTSDIPGADMNDALQYAESCGPVKSIAPKSVGYDFDKGFGIGGLGRHVEAPVIPTIAQMKRLERLEAQAHSCRRCGESDVFDGAMFTTAPSSGLCDDCFG